MITAPYLPGALLPIPGRDLMEEAAANPPRRDGLAAGQSILVKYEGYPIFHERVLVADVDPWLSAWVILTPDDDLYIEEICAPPLASIRQFIGDRGLPQGVPPGRAYLFDPPVDERGLRALEPRAAALVLAERRRLGLGGPRAPAHHFGPAAYQPGGALHVAPRFQTPPGCVWALAEPCEGHPIGTTTRLPDGVVPVPHDDGRWLALFRIAGSLARFELLQEIHVPMWAADRVEMMMLALGVAAPAAPAAGGDGGHQGAGTGGGGFSAFKRALASRSFAEGPPFTGPLAAGEGLPSADARTHAVWYDATGERRRDFSDYTTKVQVSSIHIFGIDRPRAIAWALMFVFRNGGNFNSRHTKFVSENSLSRTDQRVIFHGVISEVMDLLCCVDQVD